jgi:hypothetical protein
VTRKERSDEELVAGMVATAAQVADSLANASDRAAGWVAARTEAATAQRELAEARARAARAETDAQLLRKRATRAELECELLRARLARLRAELEQSTLDVGPPPPTSPPCEPQPPEEPPAAEALRKWLQRRPVTDIDDNGAA